MQLEVTLQLLRWHHHAPGNVDLEPMQRPKQLPLQMFVFFVQPAATPLLQDCLRPAHHSVYLESIPPLQLQPPLLSVNHVQLELTLPLLAGDHCAQPCVNLDTSQRFLQLHRSMIALCVPMVVTVLHQVGLRRVWCVLQGSTPLPLLPHH